MLIRNYRVSQYITGAELGFSDRGCKILATNYLPCYYPYPEPILEQCKAVRYRYSIFIVKNLALFIIKLFFTIEFSKYKIIL